MPLRFKTYGPSVHPPIDVLSISKASLDKVKSSLTSNSNCFCFARNKEALRRHQ